MDNVEKQNLFQKNKPKTVHLNKPLIILIAGVALIIILFAFVRAFKAEKIQPKTPTNDVISQNLTPAISPKIESLPQNYQEVNKINQYLNTNPAKVSPEEQKAMDDLKQRETELENQLMNLSNHNTNPEPSESSIQTDQAKSSGLFFTGSAPSSQLFSSSQESSSETAKSSGPSEEAASAAHMTNYNTQNMQLQKMDFLKPKDQDKDIYNLHTLVKPASPYEVQAGSLLPAILITAINTSLPGEVVAQIKEDVYDSVTGRFLLIPKGSKLVGDYDSQVSYGQTRVLIAFTRVIRPDGSSILLDRITGADLAGESGMEGNVNNHWMRVLGAATLSTLLSVGAGVSADNIGNNDTYYRSAEQNAVLSGASSISQTGQDITNRAMNIQPTLTIPAGYQFNVIVNKDMVLEPYHTGVDL